MNLWQIDRAVERLCEDIEKYVRNNSFHHMTESSLRHELFICILGSGVRYEMAISYAKEISKRRLFNSKKIFDSERLKEKAIEILTDSTHNTLFQKTFNKFRYPARAADHVARSIVNINAEYGSIKNLLIHDFEINQLRRELIRLCPGIGPKQASHFIKNVGYADKVAVLDRHILRYMALLIDGNARVDTVKNIDHYEQLESRFVEVATKFKRPISVVDQSMWFVMKELGTGAIA